MQVLLNAGGSQQIAHYCLSLAAALPWQDAGGVRGDERAGFPGGSTIVATFRSPAAARDAFVAAAAHPPAGAAAALFGQSLLLAAGDAAGRAWSAAGRVHGELHGTELASRRVDRPGGRRVLPAASGPAG